MGMESQTRRRGMSEVLGLVCGLQTQPCLGVPRGLERGSGKLLFTPAVSHRVWLSAPCTGQVFLSRGPNPPQVALAPSPRPCHPAWTLITKHNAVD